MNVSFCEEQISFKLFSPPPGSSMLLPSLHTGSQNLFIGSVYRCSNNTPQKNPRKTSRQLQGKKKKKEKKGKKQI